MASLEIHSDRTSPEGILGKIFIPDSQLMIADLNKFIQLSIVLAILKELIYKVLRLQVSLLELDRFRILFGEREEGQSAFLTQGTVSNIPIVFSRSDSIRPEATSFLMAAESWLVASDLDVLLEHSITKDNTLSNPEASQSNLAVISHLLPLKFSNLSTRLSEFSFQIVKILLYDHPAISKTFYFIFYVLNAVEREFHQSDSKISLNCSSRRPDYVLRELSPNSNA
ncbi:hypothetical protein Tco_1483073 [Tanacetum coccineum]